MRLTVRNEREKTMKYVTIVCVLLLSLILTGCANPPLEMPSPAPTKTSESGRADMKSAPTTPPKVFELNNPDPYAAKYAEVIEFYWSLVRWENGSDSLDRFEEAVDNLYDRVGNPFRTDNEQEAYELGCSSRELKISGNGFGYLGYAIYDVNGDGIPELFIEAVTKNMPGSYPDNPTKYVGLVVMPLI